jgi:hypothetical protein
VSERDWLVMGALLLVIYVLTIALGAALIYKGYTWTGGALSGFGLFMIALRRITRSA